jgi:hypothetical protein
MKRQKNLADYDRRMYTMSMDDMCVIHFQRVRIKNGNVESLERCRTAGWIIARHVPLGMGNGIIRLTTLVGGSLLNQKGCLIPGIVWSTDQGVKLEWTDPKKPPGG